jgi:TctA family transporter
LILLFCLIGVYSLNNKISEIGLMLCFGVLGYLMKKFKFDGAPLILAMVLGPLMDKALRQSLIMSGIPASLETPSHPLESWQSFFVLPLLPAIRRFGTGQEAGAGVNKQTASPGGREIHP